MSAFRFLSSAALMRAIDQGHEDIVKILLQHDKEDVNLANRDCGTALSPWSVVGRKEIVVELLKHDKINVEHTNAKGKTAVDLAQDNGHDEITKWLAKHDQNRSPCEAHEKQEFDTEPTPVHEAPSVDSLLIKASRAGKLQDVRELLEARANINAEDEDGDTALIWASYKGHYSIVAYLLWKHHDILELNHQNVFGSTALLWAIDRGHEDIVKLLLQQDKVDVNLANRDGDTALSLASVAGREEIVVELLKHDKINVDHKNNFGKTALDLARDNGHNEIVRCLTEHVQNSSS